MKVQSDHSFFRLLIFAFLYTLLSACATNEPLMVGSAKGQLFEPAPRPNDGKVILYIYRPGTFGSKLAAPLIFIDDQEVVLLRNGGYTWVYLEPGMHLIEARCSSAWRYGEEGIYKILIQSGPNSYVRVKTETKMHLDFWFPPFSLTTNFVLIQVEENEAIQEIKEAAFIEPLKR